MGPKLGSLYMSRENTLGCSVWNYNSKYDAFLLFYGSVLLVFDCAYYYYYHLFIYFKEKLRL